MIKMRSIRVTEDLLAALKELKKSLKAIPAGEERKQAQAALRILTGKLEGEPETLKKVASCPRDLPSY